MQVIYEALEILVTIYKCVLKLYFRDDRLVFLKIDRKMVEGLKLLLGGLDSF